MFAGVDQAPTEREIERQFNLGKLRGGVFTELGELEDGTPIKAGDAIRFVILNDPGFLDSLWDSAQENAEERAEKLEAEFARHGIVAHQRRVQGAEMETPAGGPIEVYVLEYEIDATIETWDSFGPMDPLVMAAATAPASGTVGFLKWFVAHPGVVAVLAGLGIAWKISSNVSSAFEVSGPQIEGTFFWIAVAVVAASVAYSIGKLKGNPST